ncbi:RluA family pseudouridine synthase [Rhodomicrobium sp. Az07]|uniref:RluA family pseudouridine synthase n=1 Tax=Rhodomicrobium sp. Az07 TaxID=2839034 RepID=UPI001BE63D69|nr:RluA family pseudouridine synthase [Rhodomicrobium sp. Az07]MBT3071853.1 RluA family pseudouridine synthase [Rhodomicrobium sp. Az07]
MTSDVFSPARYEVSEDDAGMRLDRFLASRIETQSRARLQELIRAGHVVRLAIGRAPEASTDPSQKVRVGDAFDVTTPPAEEYAVEGEEIELKVVYEDASLIVIDKPAGLVVHPGAGNPSGTLVNALIAHCGDSLSGIGGVTRPGIVHRLDKNTSGLMVVAKTDTAHRSLSAQFADHGRTGALRREYLALVWGEAQPRAGRIDAPIARHPGSRVKMAVVRNGGREAATVYTTERVFRLGKEESQSGAATGKWNNTAALSVLKCKLETGRTHQVRVHLAHIGVPLIGDSVYGAGFRTKALALPDEAARQFACAERQALHAAGLRFEHPSSRKVLSFQSPMPEDIAQLCKALERFDAKLSKN